METVWFILVAFMLTAYVVLDGFDLGAGIINCSSRVRMTSAASCCERLVLSGTETRSGC